MIYVQNYEIVNNDSKIEWNETKWSGNKYNYIDSGYAHTHQ